jgi:ribonucleoside-diphosphate reductase alpha chain
MLENYDLDQLAAALDPVADLDFDYLGIQTLYDRYLIVDKTGAADPPPRDPAVLLDARLNGPLQARGEGPRGLGHPLYNSTRAAASARPRPPCSTPAPCTASSPPATSTRSTTRSSRSCNAASRRTPSSPSGPAASGARGPASAAPAATSRAPTAKARGHPVPQAAQRPARRRQPGRKAPWAPGCAYLETWHNDIEDFLELRKNTGDDRRRCHDMNTANWIPDSS